MEKLTHKLNHFSNNNIDTTIFTSDETNISKTKLCLIATE